MKTTPEKPRVIVQDVRHRCTPQRTHAVADAAVVYVVLLETAKGILILGGFATFIVVAMLFVFLGGDET